ncbi:nucleoside recognition domain-containing protein [Pasteuria penetrans]|uniref:nucleoside recognition domain-containing protein n=1 Tax=Pasteuria penetrans TaxID=86005 RepID=UPI00165C6AAB|nr:nucleoside recognition domain-containing protein [Pasteuria penetrans]
MRYQKGVHAVIIGGMALLLLSHPEPAIQGSLHGMRLWWQVIMPSLLPFIVVAEILFHSGIIENLGRWVTPIFRPLLGIPGSGSLVLLLGWMSGNPTGALLAARLRREGWVTQSEGERILVASCTSGPLFLCGAVAAGFFQRPELAIHLLGGHHLGNLLLLFLLRCTLWRTTRREPSVSNCDRQDDGVMAVLRSPQLSLGAVLREAAERSMQTMLVLLGILTTFSAILHLVKFVGFFSWIHHGLVQQDSAMASLVVPVLVGGVEMTLGIHDIVAQPVDLLIRLGAVAAVAAFGGFCIHAQVASLLVGTDLRYRVYCLARLGHAFLAILSTVGLALCFSLPPVVLPVSSPVPSTGVVEFHGAHYLWIMIGILWLMGLRRRYSWVTR